RRQRTRELARLRARPAARGVPPRRAAPRRGGRGRRPPGGGRGDVRQAVGAGPARRGRGAGMPAAPRPVRFARGSGAPLPPLRRAPAGRAGPRAGGRDAGDTARRSAGRAGRGPRAAARLRGRAAGAAHVVRGPRGGARPHRRAPHRRRVPPAHARGTRRGRQDAPGAQAAQRLRPGFPDRVVVVPLAGVAAPEGVSVAVAQAAGVRLRGGPSPLDQVVAALRDRHALLLLDEFEHLLGAALVVDELLASCRGLRALVTSRERLRLQAEWLLPLAGLPVPPEDVVDGAEALAYAAARLLSDRARQVAPGFRLDGDDLPPAVALCRFLDGLPLGVELAAASLRTLAPRE